MGLSTVLNLGLDVYEAYDDGMFDGFLQQMSHKYPDMLGTTFLSTQAPGQLFSTPRFGYPSYPPPMGHPRFGYY